MIENIALAFQGIWGHKMRSILTMLGIIIGIASIISIVSTIKGTNEQIKQNLIGSGNNAVQVRLSQGDDSYDMSYNSIPKGVPVLTEDDRKNLADLDKVQDASLYTARSYADNVFYKDTTYSGAVYGIDSHYFNVMDYYIQWGREFVQSDYDTHRKVVIIDRNAMSALFPAGVNPIGQSLEIAGQPFTVVGVCDASSSYTPTIKSIQDYYNYTNSSSGAIYIPGTSWSIPYQFDEPQNVVLKADSTDDMTKVGNSAADYLNKKLTVDKDSNISYKSEDLLTQARNLQQLSTSTSTQLIWIASISLLVGGIGVMNIMLVSVTERTSEIGLKKALGAKKKRILGQFLTEASVLTSFGGILGVVAGIILSRVISRVAGTPTAISVPAIIVAVVFSTVIGIIFGLFPAVKASNLNPIDALRHE